MQTNRKYPKAQYSIEITPNTKYIAVIRSESYLNPIDEISDIATDLKSKGVQQGLVLFDLLLCNGDAFNRFGTCEFKKDYFDEDTLDIVKLDDTEVHLLNSYYIGKAKILNQSALTDRKKFLYMSGKA